MNSFNGNSFRETYRKLHTLVTDTNFSTRYFKCSRIMYLVRIYTILHTITWEMWLQVSFCHNQPKITNIFLHRSMIKINKLSFIIIELLRWCIKQEKQLSDQRRVFTSSWQCILAMPSDSRIILSSCLTVILHADLAAPVPSLCLKRLYSSIIYSWASLLIYNFGQWIYFKIDPTINL